MKAEGKVSNDFVMTEIKVMLIPRVQSASFLGLLLLCTLPALGCNNPAVHPEMAEFNALLEALPAEAPGPVQLKFKIDGDIKAGQSAMVRVAFWQREPCKSGRYVITPSAGVALESSLREGVIPCRGSIELTVRAASRGYHHLKMETHVETDGASIQRTELVGLPVGLNDLPVAETTVPGRFDFAGSKLRGVLAVTQGAETLSQQPSK
ncbi:MAG: hypothetical protein JZU52_09745 [Lamprocystis purpurea]|uniref:hypothetical protein n=1 Tax=Lamprocystis purpurea TaxID=61598 RepID=UPI0012F9FB4B|nr:hypothetical protein [Lamprocystis purpurea]MBV5273903.1 hypothetical protein [Lamprocystis purpurea]